MYCLFIYCLFIYCLSVYSLSIYCLSLYCLSLLPLFTLPFTCILPLYRLPLYVPPHSVCCLAVLPLCILPLPVLLLHVAALCTASPRANVMLVTDEAQTVASRERCSNFATAEAHQSLQGPACCQLGCSESNREAPEGTNQPRDQEVAEAINQGQSGIWPALHALQPTADHSHRLRPQRFASTCTVAPEQGFHAWWCLCRVPPGGHNH